MRVPIPGMRVKLIPTAQELEECQQFGRQLAEVLVRRQPKKVLDMADLI
jgi:hypothetical protein